MLPPYPDVFRDLFEGDSRFRLWRPVLKKARDVAGYADLLFSGYDEAFASMPYRAKFSLGGAAFEMATNLPEQLALAERALAGKASVTTPTGRLLISGGASVSGGPPVPLWENHSYNDRRLCQKFEASDLRLHHYRDRDFWQFYDRASGRGAQLMASPISFPDWDAGSPLRNLLRWHLTTAEQGFVHAGTIGYGGRGLMLAGPGGSGKSGTVLAGLLHGMESVGDDYVLARICSDGGVAVKPIFKTLKCDRSGLERLRLLDASSDRSSQLGHQNWQGKHQFTFGDIAKSDPSQEMKIAAICVPTVTGGRKTLIVPMPRSAAFLALAQTGFKQMPGDTRLSLQFCSDLIKRVPSYRIELGTDPDEIAGVIREFLHHICHETGEPGAC